MNSVSTHLLDHRYRITRTLIQRPHERQFAARHVVLGIRVHLVAVDLPARASTSPRDASVAHLWTLAARAAVLRHPSLVRVRDCFRHARTFSVVMEEVPGETLAARLARQGRLSLRETLTYGLQLCDLLSYLAQEGVALIPLLGITPESLVIQDDDRIVLTDLGIGRWANPRKSAYAPTSFPYRAPEVLMGAEANACACVYSLAAMLHTALAGQPPKPFGPSFLPFNALAPLAPTALGDTLEQALQPDPAARYASADEFGRALASSVRATMPAVAELARQPRRCPTRVTVTDALGAAPAQEGCVSAAVAPAQTSRPPLGKRWTHIWVDELSRVSARHPLRRTSERALAAISSALRLGA